MNFDKALKSDYCRRMQTTLKLIGLVACGCAAAVWAEDPKPVLPSSGVTWDQVSSRGRIKAEEDARENARKNLVDAIRNLQFSGPTRQNPRAPKQVVADIANEYDSINTAIEEFAKNAQLRGEGKYKPDLTCESEVAVLTTEVIEMLNRAWQDILIPLQGDNTTPPATLQKLRAVDFRYIAYYYLDDTKKMKEIVSAIGIGKPPESAIKRSTADPTVPPATATTPTASPAWTKQTITARGRADTAPGATFAAQLDAFQKLAAIKLDDKSSLGDLAAKQPKLHAALCSFVSSTPAQTSPQPDGVEATLVLSLEKLYASAKAIFAVPAK